MMPRSLALPTALFAAALAVGTLRANAHDHAHAAFAAGQPAPAATTTRTVDLTIEEKPDGSMRFEPADLHVKEGEAVRFAVKNTGKAPHEFRLDSVAGNDAHKAMMREMPGMRHHDGNGVTIAPGKTADLSWRFSKPGKFEYACLIPGHYEAGMHGSIVVAK